VGNAPARALQRWSFMKNATARTMFVMAAVCAAGLPVYARDVPRPTEPFRQEHRNLQVDLRHLDGRLDALVTATASEKQRIMAEVVGFLNEHIRPHAVWEERVLYPLVDEKAGSKPGHRFTASMRFEHTIVGRRIDELDALRRRPRVEAAAFLRFADKLLGLITAHFEEEEQVLLPILDATMTPEEFRGVMHAEERAHRGGAAPAPAPGATARSAR
jgi:hemerythrin-like domain-containing protein